MIDENLIAETGWNGNQIGNYRSLLIRIDRSNIAFIEKIYKLSNGRVLRIIIVRHLQIRMNGIRQSHLTV